MSLRWSGLLVVFLIWDFLVAPQGQSAVERGYAALANSELVQELVEQARSGELWERFEKTAENWEAQTPSGLTSPALAHTTESDSSAIEPVPDMLALAPPVDDAAGDVTVERRPVETEAPSASDEDATSQSVETEGAESAGELERAVESEPLVQAALEELPVGDDLLSAIVSAARATGAHGGYLLHIALRESGLNTSARAPTSSAAGPFQFVEQTWLSVLSRYGARHGYGEVAAQITRDAAGRYAVRDAGRLRDILGLRHDPELSALMAAEFTLENAQALSRSLGRSPHQSELYVAHVLGAGGAATLIKAVERNPSQLATVVAPAAARANRWLFYGPGDRPRTVMSLYEELTRFMSTREIAQICSADLDFRRHL